MNLTAMGFAIFGISMACLALAPAYSEQRQISPHYYVELHHESGDWSIWAGETRDRHDCFAVGLADQHSRFGHAGYFGGINSDVPYIVIEDPGSITGSLFWFLRTSQPTVETSIKLPSDKFYTKTTIALEALLRHSGSTIEAYIKSYEHPRLMVGLKEEYASFDLTEIDSIISEIENCQSAISP